MVSNKEPGEGVQGWRLPGTWLVAQGALGPPPSLPPGEGTGPAVMPFVLALGLGAAVLSEECGTIERTQRREAELSSRRLELRWVLSFSPQPPCALCPWPLVPSPRSVLPCPSGRTCTCGVCMFILMQEGPEAEAGPGWPRSLALGPVCLQDQRQVPPVSQPLGPPQG